MNSRAPAASPPWRLALGALGWPSETHKERALLSTFMATECTLCYGGHRCGGGGGANGGPTNDEASAAQATARTHVRRAGARQQQVCLPGRGPELFTYRWESALDALLWASSSPPTILFAYPHHRVGRRQPVDSTGEQLPRSHRHY